MARLDEPVAHEMLINRDEHVAADADLLRQAPAGRQLRPGREQAVDDRRAERGAHRWP